MFVHGAPAVLSSRSDLLPETPRERNAMDVLSELLGQVRLQGALFLNAEFHEPWCVNAPHSQTLAPLLKPGAQRLAICHYVLEGRCWAQVQGHAPVPLEAGDVAALPDGEPHLVGSGLQHAPVSLDHVVMPRLPELRRLRYGGAGDRTVVVCGWFSYERDTPNPLLPMLPPLFRAQVGRRPAGPWLEESIRYALASAQAPSAGTGLLASKVAEVLFTETLSGYLESLPPSQRGGLAGWGDAQVGHSLALLHAEPSRDWSVAALAQQVHMSRTAFALRFAELVGSPPMQYLKRLRLQRAAELLRSDGLSIGRVAEQVGYDSETAFNRAFKQVYGRSPGQWRRTQAGDSPQPKATA